MDGFGPISIVFGPRKSLLRHLPIHPTPTRDSERAEASSDVPPDGLDYLECPDCRLAFTTPAAYEAHRPGDHRCLSPIDVGLTVAPLRRLTWMIPRREVIDPRCTEDDD